MMRRELEADNTRLRRSNQELADAVERLTVQLGATHREALRLEAERDDLARQLTEARAALAVATAQGVTP